jgi:flagellar biosynthesis/type III secretory pathway protein FliH
MNKDEKVGRTENHSAHQFPSIQPALEDPSSPNSNANFSFRPLYQSVDDSSGGHSAEFSNRGVQNSRSPIEKIKEDCYKRGFETGKAEACQMARQELDGPIGQFKTETLHYQDCFAQITETYSDHIVRLTMSIVKSILGPDIEFDMDRQKQLHRKLRQLLQRQYQLVMKVKRDDLKTLSDIMACEDPHWHQSQAMQIVDGADTTSNGRIEADRAGTALERLQNNFSRQFQALLMDR